MILAVRRKQLVISLSQIANFLSSKENTKIYSSDNTCFDEIYWDSVAHAVRNVRANNMDLSMH